MLMDKNDLALKDLIEELKEVDCFKEAETDVHLEFAFKEIYNDNTVGVLLLLKTNKTIFTTLSENLKSL